MNDPANLTALHSLDFGSVYSSDGREHPITGYTPAYSVPTQPSSSDPVDPPSTYPATGSNQTPLQLVDLSSLFSSASHLGARFVVGIVALLVLFIVVARLVFD